MRPRRVRDRLPHARQRGRGRGRRPGGAAARCTRAVEARRADRLARARTSTTVTTRLAINAPALRPRPPRAPTSATGCRSRSSPTAGDDPARHAETVDALSLAMLVILETPLARAAGRAAAARRLRLRVRRDRGDRRQERGQRASARHPRPAPRPIECRPSFQTSREQRERADEAGASRPPSSATSRGSRRCSPHDVELHRRRRRQGPGAAATHCAAAARVARALLAWVGQGRAPARRVVAPSSRSTASPERSCSTRQQRLIGVYALDVCDRQITRRAAWIVNPDKLRHLGPVGRLQIASEISELKPPPGRRGSRA